jgi:NitT/TauT family transport system permease protein
MMLGFVVLIVIWQIISYHVHEIILASPVQAAVSLWNMIGTSFFHQHFWVTLQRMFIGIFCGGCVGFILGIAAGLNRDIHDFLEPFRWIIMSAPPVVVVVLAMLWFGMGTTMVVFIAAILVAPIVYVNAVKGIGMVDSSLVEMARLYEFSTFMLVKDVYVPAIIGPLSAAMALVTCMGVRVVILAELLGANDGMGYALNISRSNLEVPQLFAWVVVSLGIVYLFEFLLLRPVRNRFMRWKAWNA